MKVGVLSWLSPVVHLLPQSIEGDEKRKRLLIIIASLFGIPTLATFFVLDIRIHDLVGAIMDGAMTLLLCASIYMLYRLKNGIWLYRSITGALSILFTYNSICGPSGESSLVWLLLFPPIVFFILGLREGSIWFGIILMVNCVTIFNPLPFSAAIYTPEMKIRFVFAWVVIAFLSFTYELLREYFHVKLEKQSRELLDALDNIRTLKGLLPICSMCKRIRDDNGYWTKLEEYLSNHTDAMLTHGICDVCLKEKYPGVYSKRQQVKAEEASCRCAPIIGK
jgi:hypothetical protein